MIKSLTTRTAYFGYVPSEKKREKANNPRGILCQLATWTLTILALKNSSWIQQFLNKIWCVEFLKNSLTRQFKWSDSDLSFLQDVFSLFLVQKIPPNLWQLQHIACIDHLKYQLKVCLTLSRTSFFTQKCFHVNKSRMCHLRNVINSHNINYVLYVSQTCFKS